MGLRGVVSSQVEIKSAGDVYHEIFGCRPHHVSQMAPDHIQGCDLHEGDWGVVGSKIEWSYTLGGKKQVTKNIIEAIDEANKSVTFKVIGGDLAELYKTCLFTAHVEAKGENNVVTWTIEYEKISEDVEGPYAMLQFTDEMTNAIEKHHTKD